MDKAKEQKKALAIWLVELKSNLACEECGENHPATIDFHHLNFSLSKAVSSGYGKDLILKEIAKCKVLCSNCHRILHWNSRFATMI